MTQLRRFRLLPMCLLAVSMACGDSDPGSDDAGPRDAGASTDLGRPDAAARDSAVGMDARADAAINIDAGPYLDLGAVDAEPSDAENPDLGQGDAGFTDAGPSDLGPRPDAGPMAPNCNPTLGPNDACGGDPIGDWSYTTACVDPVVFATAQSACPILTISPLSAAASGTLSIRANLSFTRTATSTFIYDVNVPAACVQGLGNCASVASYIEANIPSTRRVANCSSVQGGACDCTVLVEQISNDSGSYTADSANGLIVAAGLEYHYCVIGNDMLYKGTSNNRVDGLISNVLAR